MTSDSLLSMLHACQNVIDAESQMDDMSPEMAINVLREGVKTLAVVQRDLIQSVLAS